MCERNLAYTEKNYVDIPNILIIVDKISILTYDILLPYC